MKDIDCPRNQIIVRAGQGDKDRATPLPPVVNAGLAAHLQALRRQHDVDLVTLGVAGAVWKDDLRVVFVAADTRISAHPRAPQTRHIPHLRPRFPSRHPTA